MNTKSSQEKAFTLIEISLAIFLFTTLTLIASLSFARSVQKTRLSKEAHELASEIESLSIRARQSEKVITFQTNKTYYEARVAGTLVQTHTLTQPIHFSNPSNIQLAFHPSGAASPGTVLISEGKETCAIVVSLLGRARTKCY